jgi:hypothetical protein
MLNSFTSNCFDPNHTLSQVTGYGRLMQGHFDVEMVAEEEILNNRGSQYKAILLNNVKYLRTSVYDALAAYAAHGGLLLLDASVPFDIPGAKRIAIDIGAGTYGDPEQVLLVRKALAPHIQPWFDGQDLKIAATRMQAGDVSYTWFVNVHDGKEYTFCRERMGAGVPGSRTVEKINEVQQWEEAEMAKGLYTTAIVMDSLPGAVPYDLVGGRRLDVQKRADGRFVVTVGMERFGGALVAWLPEEIASLTIAAPATATPNKPVNVAVSIVGKSGGKAPGELAVEFVLKDPLGQQHVVSGVRTAHDGMADWAWTPAVNDLPGLWTLTVKDLASGRQLERRIALR